MYKITSIVKCLLVLAIALILVCLYGTVRSLPPEKIIKDNLLIPHISPAYARGSIYFDRPPEEEIFKTKNIPIPHLRPGFPEDTSESAFDFVCRLGELSNGACFTHCFTMGYEVSYCDDEHVCQCA